MKIVDDDKEEEEEPPPSSAVTRASKHLSAPGVPSADFSSKPSFTGASASSVAGVVVNVSKDEGEKDDIILLLLILAQTPERISRFVDKK